MHSFFLCQFERFHTWANNITGYVGGKEDVFSKSKQKNILQKIILHLSNMSIVDMLYKGHLVIVDTIFRNRRCPL